MTKKNLTITSVGDVSLSTGLQAHDYSFSEWISSDVLDFLNSDIKIANLECVFYPKNEKRPEEFNLSEQDSSLKAIVEAKFNVLTLANNHITDFFNDRGVKHTTNLLNKNGILHCGAGRDLAEASKPAVLLTNGLKVGVFSRLHIDSFDDILHSIATDNSSGVAPLNTDTIILDINNAKKALGLDIIILAIHWGIQEVHNHSPIIHDIAEKIVRESSLDMILGSHSHCIQGIVNTGNKVICFGQGNFYFYPQKTPQGVLYDSEQAINRTSIATKFTLKSHKFDVESRVVYQNEQNSVSFVEERLEQKILKKVFGGWAQRKPISFYIEYRVRGFSIILSKLFSIGSSEYYRRKLISVILNPVLLIKTVWGVIFSPKHR